MCGYYRHLIPNYANIVLPLTECIKMKPNDKNLILTEDELVAFTNLKEQLAATPSLAHPVTEVDSYQLVTDCQPVCCGFCPSSDGAR